MTIAVPVPGATISSSAFGAPVVNELNGNGWLTLSLSAGWTGTLKYRAVGLPPAGVQLWSSILTAGTKANGTVIGTLPLGFLPSQQVSIPIATDVQAAGLSPHIDIATNGAIMIQGVTGCTVIIIGGGGLFSTDM